MQTCMRLCEKQKASKAVRTKLVKALVHNRQAALPHGLRKQRVCPLAIHEDLMVAVGEIENKVLSQFQSHVHSHLQGFKNIKNPSEDIELLNFNTIRKMFALCNVRNRLQIDSVAAFILCPSRKSIF